LLVPAIRDIAGAPAERLTFILIATQTEEGSMATDHLSPQTKQELPATFSCKRPDGTTYAVHTVGDYIVAIRELLRGEVRAIYRDDDAS
jgi:hypothetical protein